MLLRLDTSFENLATSEELFKLDLKTTEAACRNCTVEGNVIIFDDVIQNWFKLFLKDDLFLEINLRNKQVSIVNYNA